MREVKLIKISKPLYLYIRKIGERKYGKGLSMPYYLYRIAKEVQDGRNRR